MNVTSVKRIHQSDWTDSGVRFLRARDIVSASKNEEPDDYLYISKEKYDEYSLISGKVSVGDLLVTGVGTIGVPYLIRNSEPLYFKDGNIIWFQNGTKIDGDFFLYSFFGKAIQDFINESAGIGTVGTYTIESGKKTPISLPEMKEQQQIGAYFRNLDNLITLHQRKYDKLQVLKKAMLEKMFPKNGSSVPEIRFKGFTDAWEQRKLGEFFEKYQNTVYLQDEEEYRQISIRNTGVVEYRCTNKGKNIGRKRQYLIDTDTHPVTLTFTRQTVYEGGIGFVPKELNGAIVTENMPLLEMTNASQDFMKALFNTSGYYKSVINDDTLIGSAQKALHEKQWLDSYVCIPVLDEQKQIGSFFQQLEHLITLHQRELEKLQNIKKSMLEKMFV